jgi:HAD superfamily hydrolase (TIGR01509 family)
MPMAQAVQAIVFDFNGTLSDDEGILAGIYAELMAREGRPLAAADYARELAGNSDEAIFGRWLGLDERSARVAALTCERIALYRAQVAGGDTVRPSVREAVLLAATRLPLAVASGASREEIQPVLEAAGLGEALASIVSAGDVLRGKPHPETYERVVAMLAAQAGRPLDPALVVAFEDTEAGIRAAKGAGLRCIAVRGTLPDARLREADGIVPGISRAVVERLIAD